MEATACITPLQFSPARQTLQHLTRNNNVVSDHMPGVTLDPHHSARVILKQYLN
jgi:hypothetical protein